MGGDQERTGHNDLNPRPTHIPGLGMWREFNSLISGQSLIRPQEARSLIPARAKDHHYSQLSRILVRGLLGSVSHPSWSSLVLNFSSTAANGDVEIVETEIHRCLCILTLSFEPEHGRHVPAPTNTEKQA
ncbi:hypothetical protein BaRGS_00024423 [Batillaria attramentaria]|uniref:Uncharacterized protein n=1 Tax=Batillaria attramentaria TaxID=370345 RepID=A0ABD0KB18_9CAEN